MAKKEKQVAQEKESIKYGIRDLEAKEEAVSYGIQNLADEETYLPKNAKAFVRGVQKLQADNFEMKRYHRKFDDEY